VGGVGDLGCFSFYPAKNLGAYGEGGIVVTNSPEHERTLRILRDWGQDRKYHHLLKGYNFRMDALQGAVLRIKLRHLDSWTDARRSHASRYNSEFIGSNVEPPRVMPWARHVYHVYVIRTPSRDVLRQQLQHQGIQSGIHYPIPIHLQPGYADLGYPPGTFPHSERAAMEVLSLPMYPELSPLHIDTIVQHVHAAVGRSTTHFIQSR
jgi:dTDP-4-amino-4,6-dideoxygalactose transaminase